MNAQTFEFLTPCFCAGAYRDKPEIRVSSIRGQLRFWTRVLFRENRQPDRHTEHLLFGGLSGKKAGFENDPVSSGVRFRVASDPFKEATSDLLPHKHTAGQKSPRQSIPSSTRFHLSWEITNTESRKEMDKLQRILRAWGLLGGLGARATRAAGSVWPAAYQPSLVTDQGPSEFTQALDSLQLPGDVHVFVLNRQGQTPDALRALASNTTSAEMSGHPLGFAEKRDRKVSPLKFKVGHFKEGYRLIAIWDNREGRGGSLGQLIDALKACDGRKLGELLEEAGMRSLAP